MRSMVRQHQILQGFQEIIRDWNHRLVKHIQERDEFRLIRKGKPVDRAYPMLIGLENQDTNPDGALSRGCGSF